MTFYVFQCSVGLIYAPLLNMYVLNDWLHWDLILIPRGGGENVLIFFIRKMLAN